jgi:divalent metal cation (Fe/Co/Zn/Cd) transporter
MGFLFFAKIKVGKKLCSAALVADAHCTLTCFYLSFVLLASSLLYLLFKIPYSDALGSLGIAWFAFREGREALGKARSGNPVCSCSGTDDECHAPAEDKN